MNSQWIIPSIDPAYRDRCVATMAPEIRQRTLIVDNSRTNHGVAWSWNRGIEAAVARQADWLVIVSESMRFGPTGGRDFQPGPQARILTAGCDRTCQQVYETGEGNCRNGYGWHLIGISMDIIRRVGTFDETFWPAWFEDADYRHRMVLAGEPGPGGEEYLPGLDAHLEATEHTYAAELVPRYYQARSRDRYIEKWGGLPGAETRQEATV